MHTQACVKDDRLKLWHLPTEKDTKMSDGDKSRRLKLVREWVEYTHQLAKKERLTKEGVSRFVDMVRSQSEFLTKKEVSEFVSE